MSRQITSRSFIVGILSAIAVPILIGAWNLKENASDHKADIKNVESHHAVDSVQYQRILDQLCEIKRTRQC